MLESFHIRPASPAETPLVAAVLQEAAAWLQARGTAMWRDDELSVSRIAADVNEGLVFVAESGGEVAGTIKFQGADLLFWPDVPAGESAFIHRLAVRRSFAGSGVSARLLHWAVQRTRSWGRPFLRLDCEASRTRLRRVYEEFGFRHHSDRQVGPYYVSRYQFAVTPPE